jgi:DNA-binding CsgD family transcriptional regulator
MQLRGEWPGALAEAERACEWLSHPPAKPACGAAYYRIAELRRLRGEFAPAEAAYVAANQWERVTRPGFALLRLAQGKLGAARTTIHEAVESAIEPGSRALALDAAVTIAISGEDVTSARKAASELGAIAMRHGAPFIRAVSSRANGSVQLGEGDARSALAELRSAWNIFCELQAPYEAARARVLIALASRALGEVDTANFELTAARQIFRELGAAPDLAGAETPHEGAIRVSKSLLSAREREVLKLVASGQTNRQVAARLYISEKTVARHVSNIFNKLDLSSRAAATAYAYQHGLA